MPKQRLSSKKGEKEDDPHGLPFDHKSFVDYQLLTLDEYDFPHAITLFENKISMESLRMGYQKCVKHLGLTNTPDLGVTCLVSPNWMFLAPIAGPYIHKNNQPVYLDGYAFAGILDI